MGLSGWAFGSGQGISHAGRAKLVGRTPSVLPRREIARSAGQRAGDEVAQCGAERGTYGRTSAQTQDQKIS
jgi:hypothetical protein